MSQGEIATYMALIIGIAGGAGTFLSGWIADRLSKRDLRWYMWTVAIIGAVSLPFAVAQFLTTDSKLVFLFFIIPAFAGSAFMGPCFAMTQVLVSLRMRAVAAAMLLFILNLIGMGLGPQSVGILSDLYRTHLDLGEESLRYALLSIMVVTLWSVLHFCLAARTLRADVAHAAKSS
jgi:MFS family permease